MNTITLCTLACLKNCNLFFIDMSGGALFVYVLIKFTTDSFLVLSYTYYSWSHTPLSAMTVCAI